MSDFSSRVIISSALEVREVESARADTERELNKPDPSPKAFDQILGMSAVMPPRNQVKAPK